MTTRLMRHTTGLSRVLALLLIGVILRHYGDLLLAFIRSLRDPPLHTSLSFMILEGGFLALLSVSAIGLFRGRQWGVYSAYVLVPVSTILLGIPLVPFISDLLPTLQLRIAAVAILNILFLLAVGLIHAGYRRPLIVERGT